MEAYQVTIGVFWLGIKKREVGSLHSLATYKTRISILGVTRWTEREENRAKTRYLSELSSALLARPAQMIGFAPGLWKGVVTYVKEGLDALGILGRLEGCEESAGRPLSENRREGNDHGRGREGGGILKVVLKLNGA